MTYAAEVLASSPLVYLRLGETSGTVATDSSGNGRDGTYYNTPTLGALGLLSNDADLAMQTVVHYHYPSTNEFVSCPVPAWGSYLSVEVWMRTFPRGYYGMVFSSGPNGNSCMDITTSNGDISFTVWILAPGGLLGYNTSNISASFAQGGGRGAGQDHEAWFDIADGQVHHIVGTYDATTSRVELYVDGRLRRHLTYDEKYATVYYAPPPVALPLVVNLGGATIADFGSGNLFQNPFEGILDEAAVYNTVLTSGTIASHFTTGSGRINSIHDVLITVSASPSIVTSMQGSLSIDVDLGAAQTSTSQFTGTLDIEVGLSAVLSVIPLNDDYANREVLSGNIGQVSYDLYAATAEGGDPAFLTGGHTVWYEWTANADGQMTLTTGPDRLSPTSTVPWIDTLLGVYTSGTSGLTIVDENDDKPNVDGSISEILFNAVAGVTYYFAVDAYSGAPYYGYADAAIHSGAYYYGPGTLDWALRTPPPVVFSTGNVSTVILPATMNISIANLPSGTTVLGVYWDNVLLTTVAVDASGVLLNQTITLPVSDTIGAHILALSADSGASYLALFTVNVVQGSVPAVPIDPIFPTVVPQSGVIKWVLDDTGATPDQYIFAINPNAMTSPFGAKNITSRASTGPNGQKIAWEGAQGPVVWEWSGDLFSQQMYDKLNQWVAKGHRIFLTDHLLRRWEIYLTEFTPIPRRSGQYPWRNAYTMKALVMGPPTDVS